MSPGRVNPGREATATFAARPMPVSSIPPIHVATYGLTWLAGTIYVMATADGGARGRYLLIGIPALGALVAYGLSAVTPARLRVQTALTSTALLAAVAMACLFGIYLPAYRPTRVAPNYEPSLLIRYGDAAELIGIEPATVHARPGETVRIQLVWRALGPTETSLYADLHSVGGNVVFRDSLPATGRSEEHTSELQSPTNLVCRLLLE